MSKITKITRRGFLKGSAGITASSLLLGISVPGSNAVASETGKALAPSAFISIEESGIIVLVIPHQEMGQGSMTGLIQILADELEAEWKNIRYFQAPGHPDYGDQRTVGSFSIKMRYTPFRQAGAAAKEMLIAAAAKIWDVPVAELAAKEGAVYHEKSGKGIAYGRLVNVARSLPVPKNPKLKKREDFNYIGKRIMSVDSADIVQGSAVYGMDVEVPGMLHASLERSPTLTGKILSYDKQNALAVKGVVDVVEIQGNGWMTNNAVAVLASNNWAAIKGRKALNAQWESESESLESDKAYRIQLRELADKAGKVERSEGSFEIARKNAEQVISSSYYSPYLAHAPLEPMVATASVNGDSAELWVPTQDPQFDTIAVAGQLGHEPEKAFEKVKVNTTLVGGAFGRKGVPDYCMEAVEVSKAIKKPVKVTWTREDEIRHGFYRPASMQKYEAALDKYGYPTGIKATSVFHTILSTYVPGAVDPIPAEMGMGLVEMPYRIDNVQIESHGIKSDVRIGFLRSVCHTFHGWSLNNFIDEVAHAANVNPVEFRLSLLGPSRELIYHNWDEYNPAAAYLNYPFKTGRLSNVIQVAAEQGAWGQKMPEGHALGFAAHKSFNSYVAMVMDVSIDRGSVKVHKVTAAVDVGTVVNPSYVKAQVEGGIVFGLTAALYGSITVENGEVQQSNFNDYPVLRINEMPRVDITLIDSDEIPTGIGEPGVPPVAPALCNGIFNLTGKRIYELPVSKHKFI
ncbi:MAG: xanthine dehydrogenase family protein molybdopterin-binding subunit [SAR324 cluster bacterium]|nr:xanthine dehydrogenase family protein molybdopterin-binding subunit [SAR324 cluster bacterium]